MTEVANEMNNFYSELKKYATGEQEKFEAEYTQFQDKSEMFQEIKDDDELLELMLDKDNLVQHLDTSKENVGQKVEEKDNEIFKAIQDDWKNTESRIQEEQHRRNRNVVQEIIETANTFRFELGKLFHFYTHLTLNIEKEFKRLRREDYD